MENKFFGVVEGFYRKPYTFEQRLDLISFLSDVGLNTYVYGPKADPYHRRVWEKPYPKHTMKKFELLYKHARRYNACFNFALSPMSRPDTKKIKSKMLPMVEIGITNFSLFFDDIKVPLTKNTAVEQAETANELLDFLQNKSVNPIMFFCPTQYRGVRESEYILTVAERLNKQVYIFWTGMKVVSKRITEKDIDRITSIIKRKPLIWDNLFANDYIPGVTLEFPYRYRAPGIIDKVSGILLNPMNQYKKSKPLIYTAARFFKKPHGYVARKAWREARSLF